MIIHGDHIHPPRRRLKLSALPCLASLGDLYRACGSSMSFKTFSRRQRSRSNRRLSLAPGNPTSKSEAARCCRSSAHTRSGTAHQMPQKSRTRSRPVRARSKHQHNSSVPEDMDSASSRSRSASAGRRTRRVEFRAAPAHSPIICTYIITQ